MIDKEQLKRQLLGSTDSSMDPERLRRFKATDYAGIGLYEVLKKCKNKPFMKYLYKMEKCSKEELAKALLSCATHIVIESEQDHKDRVSDIQDLVEIAISLLKGELTPDSVSVLFDRLGVL